MVNQWDIWSFSNFHGRPSLFISLDNRMKQKICHCVNPLKNYCRIKSTDLLGRLAFRKYIWTDIFHLTAHPWLSIQRWPIKEPYFATATIWARNAMIELHAIHQLCGLLHHFPYKFTTACDTCSSLEYFNGLRITAASQIERNGQYANA